MFRAIQKYLGREIPALIAVHEPSIPEAQRSTSVTTTIITEEYQKKAREAGFSGLEQTVKPRTRFLEILEARCARYDMNKVHAYLEDICPENYTVMWLPLNRSDKALLWDDWSSYIPHFRIARETTMPYGIYSKPIPEPVLDTIVDLKKQFKEANVDDYKFHVSDFIANEARRENDDPFLLVSFRIGTPDVAYAVIERWDEPAFRS